MKTCFKCLAEKPLAEFYAHKKMIDGRLNKCKECTKADIAKYRSENLELVRARDRARGGHKARPTNKAVNAIKRAANRPDMDLQKACHVAVALALKSGQLTKLACQSCGSKASEAHHESYSSPLDVVWLCKGHHKRRHREMTEQGLKP